MAFFFGGFRIQSSAFPGRIQFRLSLKIGYVANRIRRGSIPRTEISTPHVKRAAPAPPRLPSEGTPNSTLPSTSEPVLSTARSASEPSRKFPRVELPAHHSPRRPGTTASASPRPPGSPARRPSRPAAPPSPASGAIAEATKSLRHPPQVARQPASLRRSRAHRPLSWISLLRSPESKSPRVLRLNTRSPLERNSEPTHQA